MRLRAEPERPLTGQRLSPASGSVFSKMKAQRSDRLRIDSVRLDSGGRIGMTLCPGKKQRGAMSGDWDRDLADDLDVIAGWGAWAVVSVILPEGLMALCVHNIGEQVNERGMRWYHLPVSDGGVPDHTFEQSWGAAGLELRRALRGGSRILIHCKGGLGRTGMLAARLLVELGDSPEEAIRKVRHARRGAIETSEQERHVFRCRKLEE